MICGFAVNYQMSLCCAGDGFPQRWAHFLQIWKTAHSSGCYYACAVWFSMMLTVHVYTSAKKLSIKISHLSIKLLDTKNIYICGSTPRLRAVLYGIIEGAD